MAFTIDCELNQERDPKLAFGTGTKVVFDYRYDGHYAQFTVKNLTAVGAINALINACGDDIYSETTFFVTNSTGQQSAWTMDNNGDLVRDEDF